MFSEKKCHCVFEQYEWHFILVRFVDQRFKEKTGYEFIAAVILPALQGSNYRTWSHRKCNIEILFWQCNMWRKQQNTWTKGKFVFLICLFVCLLGWLLIFLKLGLCQYLLTHNGDSVHIWWYVCCFEQSVLYNTVLIV